MFRCVKRIFVSAIMFFDCNKEPIFFRFNMKTNKCSGNCNNINDPYAKLRVPDVAKNLMSKSFI